MPALDLFRIFRVNLESPAEGAFSITPDSDSTEFAFVTRGLYFGNGGNATVKMVNGDLARLRNIADGTFMPMRARAVLDSDLSNGATTASNIVGFY